MIINYGNGNVVEEPVFLAKLIIPESNYERDLMIVGHAEESEPFIIGMNIIRTGIFTVKITRGMGFTFTFEKEIN